MDKQGVRHGDPEGFGGFEVDEQFEFGRLFYRQVRRLRTLENPASALATLGRFFVRPGGPGSPGPRGIARAAGAQDVGLDR